ncbi:hypothetical protein GCM10011482_09270 [Enterococcus alcedinis]|uniref:Uncharacterized protein n=1 Tax=Enterococcus alcedinis TaxID=1274384 RepID=A0A917JDL5_9ENTE|nr:hypothetical protein GCM10011482_09270 [Enterococcus alcedinis]
MFTECKSRNKLGKKVKEVRVYRKMFLKEKGTRDMLKNNGRFIKVKLRLCRSAQ